MKYKSHLISQGSGKIAGAVYAYNRAGLYIRQWRKPVNTPTDPRTEVRANMTSLVTAWTQELTVDKQESWRTYAANVPITDRLGNSIHITGQNWYIGANAPRLQMGLDRIDSAPVIFDRGTATPPQFVPNQPGQEVNVTFNPADTWANTDGAAMGIYLARPINGNRTFFKGPYLLAGIILGSSTTPPTSPVAVPVPFPIDPNQSIGCRAVVTQADGRYGTPTERLPSVSQDTFLLSVQAVDVSTADWWFSTPVVVGGAINGWMIGAAGPGYQDATGLAAVPGFNNVVRASYGMNFEDTVDPLGYNLQVGMTGITAAQPIVLPEAANLAKVWPIGSVAASGVADAIWTWAGGSVDTISGPGASLLEIDAGGLGFIAPTGTVVSGGKVTATYAVAPQINDAARITQRPGMAFLNGGLSQNVFNGTVGA